MKKIWIMMILLLCVLFSVMPMSAGAEEIVASGSCGENVTWILDNDGLLTISGSGSMEYWYSCEDTPWYTYKSQIIIAKIESGIIHISDYAFDGCTELEDIDIADTVTSLGYRSFFNCAKLKNIRFPNGLTNIGSWAFTNCSSLTSISIPSSVRDLGYNTFTDCTNLQEVFITDLGAWLNVEIGDKNANPFAVNDKNHRLYVNGMLVTELNIPDHVTQIHDYAFHNCVDLTSVTVPENVSSIGESAFSGCSSLESMILPFVGGSLKTKTDNYQFPFGYIFGQSEYPGSFATHQSFYWNGDFLGGGTYYIPVALKSVTITGGNILRGAFQNCSELTEIKIPDHITSIGCSAFEGCSSLADIQIPSGVTDIDDWVFMDCTSLETIVIPESVTEMGLAVFSRCSNLRSVEFFCHVPTVYDNSFMDCDKLQTLIFHKGAIIGSNKFYEHENLKTLVFGEGQTSIGERAFWRCSNLETVKFHGGGVTIGSSAFFQCHKLTTLELGEGVGRIGDNAFTGCSGLTSIPIPGTVTSIGKQAFSDCSGVVEVYITDLGAWLNIEMGDAESNPFAVNQETHRLYLKGELVTEAIIPENVNQICDYAFYNCADLTCVDIPSSVRSIGTAAFSGCSHLTRVDIPATVNSIGASAFSGCTSLESMTLPFVGGKQYAAEKDQHPFGYIFGKTAYDGCVATGQYEGNDTTHITQVTYYIPASLKSVAITGGNIPHCAFRNCSNLENIQIPTDTTLIRSSAFAGCTNLKHIDIPENVTTIESSAFTRCESLTTVEIPNKVTKIETYVFSGCTGLTSIKIPDSITYVSDHAFQNCSSLTDIELPNSIKAIDRAAFAGCSSLETIQIPASVSTIKSYAFSGCSMLNNVEIPDSVKTIDTYAFEGCTGLKGIKFLGDAPFINWYVFTNVTATAYYPRTGTGWTTDKLDNYSGSITWKMYCSGNIHDYTSDITLPTCTDAGYTTYTCACGHSYTGNPVAATGHTEVVDKAIEATCTETGLSEGKHCITCDEILSKQENIPALGHTYDDGICTNCGERDESIPDTGICGENATWTFDPDTGTLRVSGSGAIHGDMAGHAVFPDGKYHCKPWYEYADQIIHVKIEEGITEIGHCTFESCKNLQSVTIPESVVSIIDAFGWCDSLTDVVLPSKLEVIGDHAFAACISLKEIVIPDTVTGIGNHAFYQCENLISVSMPDSLSALGEWAFAHCASLKSITVPKGVTEIPEVCFAHCSSLETVILPESLLRIRDFAFDECSSLSGITIPSRVDFVGTCAFRNLCAQANIIFKGDVPDFQKEAFQRSTVTVYYPADNSNWTSDVMQNYSGNITWIPYGSCYHQYNVSFNWQNDDSCQAAFSCSLCDDVQIVDCEVVAITDTVNDQTIYMATATFLGQTYSDSRKTDFPPPTEPDNHKHTNQWYFDETNHWKECPECGQAELAPHEPGSATENTSTRCTICGYLLELPKSLDWFVDRIQDPDSSLYATGFYVRIMEQYGEYFNKPQK